MISRSTDIRAALRSRQRGFLLNPFRFGGGASPTWHTTFEQAGAGSNTGTLLNYTIRDVIQSTHLIAGSKIRITFRGGGGSGFLFNECWIGTRGSTFDLAATPTQVFFGGNAYGGAAAGVDLVSDQVTFAVSGSADLVVSFWIGSGSYGGSMKSWATSAGPGPAYYRGAVNAADDVPGASFSTDVSTLIRKVEVYA